VLKVALLMLRSKIEEWIRDRGLKFPPNMRRSLQYVIANPDLSSEEKVTQIEVLVQSRALDQIDTILK